MTLIPGNPDVIVVGAGTAGLAAAKALMQAGLDVVVLEAEAHAGGRCYTDTAPFDVPFDRGGSWLHSAEINPLARIAEQRGVDLHKEPFEWAFVHRHGRALSADEVELYAENQEVMWQAIDNTGALPGDRSIESALPEMPWRDTAKLNVPMMMGGDTDVTSATDTNNYDHTDGDWLVGGGLGAFVYSLHSDVPVQLNCPVTKIDTSGRGARAETPLGSINAKSLVLTVSTGVLAAERIAFTPPLPDAKLTAISQLPNGLLNKIGIEFDPAWQGALPLQIADYHSGGEEFCSIHFGFFGTSLAVAFTAARFADHLEQEGAGAATEFCLQGLRAVFGGDVMKHVRRTTETAWRSNPNALGSYSFARPGSTGARRVLAETVDEKLYFAGEATMPDAFATVHGAYRSGLDVAQKIIAAHR